MGVTIRAAGGDDVPAIAAIYAHHVLTGIATFEEVPPDAAEMARQIAREIPARRPANWPLPGPPAG